MPRRKSLRNPSANRLPWVSKSFICVVWLCARHCDGAGIEECRQRSQDLGDIFVDEPLPLSLLQKKAVQIQARGLGPEASSQALEQVVTAALPDFFKSCHWYNPVGCVIQGIEAIGEAITNDIEEQISRAWQVEQARKQAEEWRKEESSPAFINNLFAVLLFGLIGFAVLGKLVDYVWPDVLGKGRSPIWVLCLLIASYALLTPGIMGILFSVNIWLDFSMGGITVSFKQNGVVESMIDLIQILWKTGGFIGCVLVIFYAIVIPVVKVVCLVLGECWRNCESERKRSWAKTCISIVQVVSKWACPDCFAYILLLYLIRHLNHPPLILTTARLEVGFLCFTMFCVSSTVGALFVPMPQVRRIGESPPVSPSSPRSPSGGGMWGWCSPRAAKLLALALSGGFFLGWGIGLTCPCMAGALDVQQMHVPGAVKDLVESLNLQKLLFDSVSVAKCIIATAAWTWQGGLQGVSAPILMSFLLLSIFVVVLPAVDMILLLVVAVTYEPTYVLAELPTPSKNHDGPTQALVIQLDSELAAKRVPHWGFAICHYLKHLALLDVFVVGVIIVCAAGSTYRKQGVEIMFGLGIIPLCIAEICHYLMYSLVSKISEVDDSL